MLVDNDVSAGLFRHYPQYKAVVLLGAVTRRGVGHAA